jgi:hypothetical protein
MGFEPARNWVGLVIIWDDTRASDDVLHRYVKYATTRIEHVDVGQWVKDISLNAASQNESNVPCVK